MVLDNLLLSGEWHLNPVDYLAQAFIMNLVSAIEMHSLILRLATLSPECTQVRFQLRDRYRKVRMGVFFFSINPIPEVNVRCMTQTTLTLTVDKAFERVCENRLELQGFELYESEALAFGDVDGYWLCY